MMLFTTQRMHLSSRRRLFILVVLSLVLVGIYGAYRPLPREIGMKGATYLVPDEDVIFLSDETFVNTQGERVSEQRIFDEVMRMIAHADSYILVDMFLWNSFQGAHPETHRALSDELADALIAKKNEIPDMTITVISDPINTVYNGVEAPQFTRMERAGIPVIMTDHSALRDSNPLYSAFWRAGFQWVDLLHNALFGRPYTVRLFPNVMDADGEDVPLRSYLKLANFKANHRKLIVADSLESGVRRVSTLVTSANPHDGSSAHSNVAILARGGVWKDAVRSEKAVAHFSGGVVPLYPNDGDIMEPSGDSAVTLLTESAILSEAMRMIDSAKAGDRVDLAIFYLSERKIINALISAAERGVIVRIILDPNKDAFGMKKNGIPNRSVASRLVRETNGKIKVRWCATHGEQCHGKMLLVSTKASADLLLGSANYTRRNLRNLNLETDIHVASAVPSTAFRDAEAYMERMWTNAENRHYTEDYETYRDDSLTHRIIATVMESTGLSTF